MKSKLAIVFSALLIEVGILSGVLALVGFAAHWLFGPDAVEMMALCLLVIGLRHLVEVAFGAVQIAELKRCAYEAVRLAEQSNGEARDLLEEAKDRDRLYKAVASVIRPGEPEFDFARNAAVDRALRQGPGRTKEGSA